MTAYTNRSSRRGRTEGSYSSSFLSCVLSPRRHRLERLNYKIRGWKMEINFRWLRSSLSGNLIPLTVIFHCRYVKDSEPNGASCMMLSYEVGVRSDGVLFTVIEEPITFSVLFFFRDARIRFFFLNQKTVFCLSFSLSPFFSISCSLILQWQKIRPHQT